MEGQELGNRSILGERHGPGSVTHSLSHLLSHTPTLFYRKCRNHGSRLPLHVPDTAANIQDGSPLEFVATAAARECNIQDARGRGLWHSVRKIKANFKSMH